MVHAVKKKIINYCSILNKIGILILNISFPRIIYQNNVGRHSLLSKLEDTVIEFQPIIMIRVPIT